MDCLCIELDSYICCIIYANFVALPYVCTLLLFSIMQVCDLADLYKKQCTPPMADISTTVKREFVNVLPSDG